MYFRKEIEYVKFDYAIDSNELLVLKTRVMSPPITFNGLFLKDVIIQYIYNLSMAR